MNLLLPTINMIFPLRSYFGGQRAVEWRPFKVTYTEEAGFSPRAENIDRKSVLVRRCGA